MCFDGGVYRIGSVARLAQVSVRTLRHFDDVGLLSPARVDADSGYRWYAPGGRPRDLGFRLARVPSLEGK